MVPCPAAVQPVMSTGMQDQFKRQIEDLRAQNRDLIAERGAAAARGKSEMATLRNQFDKYKADNSNTGRRNEIANTALAAAKTTARAAEAALAGSSSATSTTAGARSCGCAAADRRAAGRGRAAGGADRRAGRVAVPDAAEGLDVPDVQQPQLCVGAGVLQRVRDGPASSAGGQRGDGGGGGRAAGVGGGGQGALCSVPGGGGGSCRLN